MVLLRCVGRVPVVAALSCLFLMPAKEVQAQVTSCHNPFVNGVTRVSAKFRIDLDIEKDDWSELTQLLENFAASNSWSFRNTSKVEPGVLNALYLSLCTDHGLRIHVVEQRWASRGYVHEIPGRGVGVPIYGNVPQAVWRRIAAEIVEILEVRWPDRVRFRSGDGRLIDRPEFLSDSLANSQ
jgi:hypothetical protein